MIHGKGTVVVAKDEETALAFLRTREGNKLFENLPGPLHLIVESKNLNDHKPKVAIIISKWNGYDAGCRSNEHVYRGYSRMYERASRMIMVNTSTFQ